MSTCPNHLCVDGWVAYEPNESGAAPPIVCRASDHGRVTGCYRPDCDAPMCGCVTWGDDHDAATDGS